MDPSKVKHVLGAWLGVIVGATLLLAATLHRLQLYSSHYTKSSLISIEFVLVILQGLIVFFYHPGNAIVLAVKKEWSRFLLMLLAALLGFLFLVLALQVDAPTLLYMI